MNVNWAPLESADFVDGPSAAAFVELKKKLTAAATLQTVRSSPLMAAAAHECSARGCSARTCRLHTGCVFMQAKQDGAGLGELEWRSVSEMAGCESQRVQDVLTGYNRDAEVAVVLLLPPDVLKSLLLAPPGSVGVYGVAKVSYAALGAAHAKHAFRESSSGWVNEALHHVDFDHSKMDEALASITAHSVQGMGEHGTLAPHLKKSADDVYATDAVAAKRRLQAVVNGFWGAFAQGQHQRLAARARRVRCSPSHTMDCDGTHCRMCRGAMVFELHELDQGREPWSVRHKGQVLSSAQPKQMRGAHHTALELQSRLGCNDADLLHTVMSHDRRTSFVVVLHVPAQLLEPSHTNVPPDGVLLWRLLAYAGPPTLPRLPPPLQPQPPADASGPPSAAEARSDAASAAGGGEEQQQEAGAAGSGRASSAGTAGAGPGAPEAGGHALQAQEQQGSSAAAAQAEGGAARARGPHVCALCGLFEEACSGVHLFSCPCGEAAYCGPAHQAQHWKAHKLVCSKKQ